MSKIRVHFDGWIALPARLRQALRLEAGDELEAEVKDGVLVLVSARKGPAAERTVEPAAAAPATTASTAAATMVSEPPRRRGRPRKVAAPSLAAPLIKVGGWRRSASAPPSPART